MLARWKQAAERLAIESAALGLAALDVRTPWYAKAWSILVVAYALSPIDLIPDFIPLLGYLDDLLIVPAGIWLALKMIPPPVMQAAREKAQAGFASDPRFRRIGLAMVLSIWILMAAGLAALVMKLLR